MIQRAGIAAASLFLAVVLLLNFHGPEATAIAAVKTDTTNRTASTGAAANGSSTGSGSGAGSSTGSGSAAGSGTSTGTGSGSGSGSGSTATGTFQGQTVSMPYGYVQVAITLKNGKITDVTLLQAPSGGHSGRIANYAVPILRTEALQAQSATIDLVSGATYTSEAYAMSLQSALDSAHA